MGFGQPEESTRNPLSRQRGGNQASSRHPPSRSYLQRPSAANPYRSSASQFSQFPFASRQAQNAPLFYSATDEFREEDDEEEREREVADFYALQRSRRQFGGSRLEESSEGEDDRSRTSGLSENGDGRDADERGRGRAGGIKSSWKGGRSKIEENKRTPDDVPGDLLTRIDSETSSKGKDRMVDIGLESTTHGSAYGDDPPEDIAFEIPPEDDPPSIQQFRNGPKTQFESTSPFIPQPTSSEAVQEQPHPPASDTSEAPPAIGEDSPRHDQFWGSLYLICLAALFASFFLVYLHTYAPSNKHPLGDTVYTTVHASYHLLAIDTMVAVIVSLFWLAALRSYVRPLVYAMLVAVPIILFSFSLYPFISSFRGQWHGASVQDKAMRWFSFIPAVLSGVWTISVYRGRHSFTKAISILEFACKILAANPGLLLVGFGTLLAVITWTWVWMAMFTRVFLGGHLSGAKNFFIIDTSTWFLGLFFILVYLWTLSVGAGIQRATTAATVSQWYFHRLSVPAPSSRAVILAALSHSLTTSFGTICLSTLLALLVRLPFLILPRRFLAFFALCAYPLIPTSVQTMTNPLTLTYAAIHSQPLSHASHALSRLHALSPSSARQFSTNNNNPHTNLQPYNLSLLLLRATRLITSLALGFGAWVNTARLLTLQNAAGNTVRGSLYAYIVGLIAAAIGWGVLGSVDGVVTGVVDAGVVCWGSEMQGGGGVRYCREAGEVFGDERSSEEEGRGFWR